jgi:hypothetical protein
MEETSTALALSDRGHPSVEMLIIADHEVRPSTQDLCEPARSQPCAVAASVEIAGLRIFTKEVE